MPIDRKKGRAASGSRKGGRGVETAPATRGRPAARPAQAAKPVRSALVAEASPGDPALFAPLTEGERADAVRLILEDERVRAMAKIGRYRVVMVEPLVAKPPRPLAGQRLARVIVYDYSSDQSLDGCVDLDRATVCGLAFSRGQPPLSAEEELAAASIAGADARVVAAARAHVPLGVLHYWSRRAEDLASRRRSAAVLFGPAGGPPTLVAVVDLVDGTVLEVVPTSQW